MINLLELLLGLFILLISVLITLFIVTIKAHAKKDMIIKELRYKIKKMEK